MQAKIFALHLCNFYKERFYYVFFKELVVPPYAGTELCDRKNSKKFMHKTHTDENLNFFVQRTRKFFMPWTWTRIKDTFTRLWYQVASRESYLRNRIDKT